MDTQLQIRRNAQGAQQYLNDLLKWQQEQKLKDDKLRRDAASENIVDGYPQSDITSRQPQSSSNNQR